MAHHSTQGHKDIYLYGPRIKTALNRILGPYTVLFYDVDTRSNYRKNYKNLQNLAG